MSTSSMRHSVNTDDIALFGQLDMVYNHLRFVEAEQNKGKFACKGSGRCCKIGLRVHMFECASIAYHIRQEYYLVMEDKGKDAADEFMNSTVDRLVDAMFDKDWKNDGFGEISHHDPPRKRPGHTQDAAFAMVKMMMVTVIQIVKIMTVAVLKLVLVLVYTAG